jgi:hypothetical protein
VNYDLAESSKTGLGLIPLKVPIAAGQCLYCLYFFLFFPAYSLPELSRKSSLYYVFVWGFTVAYTLHDPTPPGPTRAPRAHQGLPNAPSSGFWAHPRHSIPLVGSSDDICNVSCARNVIWATFQHISCMGRDRGQASYEMYDVHDVHDFDRLGAGPISSPIRILFF